MRREERKSEWLLAYDFSRFVRWSQLRLVIERYLEGPVLMVIAELHRCSRMF